MTYPEVLLWSHLKGGRRKGHPAWRAQHPCDLFILDFYCASAKLALEVDGSYHNTPEQQAKDAERTRHLNERGIRVIRASATDVIANPAAIAAWAVSESV